ncbi:transcriptional regulator [Desulfolithobacter dissulfuricans]|uniref:Transcriptional regulator n=1 Tax=Desulfolithobacter dissulfuricans TaxID=2795293 RepID=A0A915TYZ3_9BACT|nr:helix-turn-helix transcriptional regulator [Desulfolithobacter dissulfuricans]BCO07839.1 transcriptional regulator [Desulfolithobacter dissulfuricans]
MARQDKPSGGIPMIRIDGTRIRQLREAQGLTQLYVATSVGVTTDTISRWENNRSPTIKRENGIRLAEVLGVELDEILESRERKDIQQPDTSSSEAPKATGGSLPTGRSLLATAGLLMLLLLGVTFLRPDTENMGKADIQATRLLPAACAPGLPFPVVIKVSTGDDRTFLVREVLPEGVEVLQTMPKATILSGNVLKWLHKKDNGPKHSGYLARARGPYETRLLFRGDVAIRQESKQKVATGGNDTMVLKPVHWADTNGDYVISDDEILEVYDRYGELPGLDLDRIEEMWMGSGYRWNQETRAIEVLP